MTGQLNANEKETKLFAEEVAPLYTFLRDCTQQVHIKLDHKQTTPEKLDDLFKLIRNFNGSCPLLIGFYYPDGQYVWLESDEAHFIRPEKELADAVNALFGSRSWSVRLNIPPLPETKRWNSRKKEE